MPMDNILEGKRIANLDGDLAALRKAQQRSWDLTVVAGRSDIGAPRDFKR